MDFLAILFFLFLAIIIIIGESQKRKKRKNRIKPIISDIKDISTGFVEIKGKLKQINTMTSPMTRSECIGYSYSIMRFNSSRKKSVSSIDRGISESKERDRHIKWETISSDTACNDFYIEDHTDRIKVKAKGISIFLLNVNQADKKISGSMHTENLLLQDDREYVLVGTAKYNKKNELIIKKSDNEFVISDTLVDKLSKSDLPNKISKYGLIFMLLLIGLILLFVNGFLK
ncbi:GIDE domain-containing protein [uncultured Aquimarina sp.]|uniref:GIDE domain-containing protein n=1 Tax=uncultured Aquimarina sp. TaxID=575652 RepID=UPI00260D6870|nr:GIDE domain-containing protein [uncultured Aquimarina sp.]